MERLHRRNPQPHQSPPHPSKIKGTAFLLWGSTFAIEALLLLASLNNMPRPHLIRTNQHPYHIVCRSNNREWFYIPIEDFWKITLEIMAREAVSASLRIHAFVLMSNHFHLLASSVDGNLDEPMRYLLREVCREVNKQANRINHVFGGPYKWTVITKTSYYLHCLKYIYRNPVNAQICKRVEDYPYSTISAYENPEKFPVSIHHWKWAGDWLKWGDYQSVLNWLNTPYPHGLNDYVRAALKKKTFEIPKNRNTGRIPQFFEDLSPLHPQKESRTF